MYFGLLQVSVPSSGSLDHTGQRTSNPCWSIQQLGVKSTIRFSLHFPPMFSLAEASANSTNGRLDGSKHNMILWLPSMARHYTVISMDNSLPQ